MCNCGDCSDLPVSSNGAWVLNTRNGMCNGNAGKMLQMHEWNFKQGLYWSVCHMLRYTLSDINLNSALG